ncbi:uncharacterized protein EV420DRAFT_314212 [Desarmillaria tabescens]|uniref:Uncharacterized protein n=1 Tax=Armillaria tabescens TaxID=1929756 RepID=A0AA39KI12_ARMTA|nr:uncharacterized protein EV420DRAFT_314212 [Desarmillaria tabescens]KAK0459298.1 hypothetical protein EV420DRAFT_314212 [Desarmillaria tabescens]
MSPQIHLSLLGKNGMATLFPQELIDTIIDNLADDHAALKCMSLTSRAFYPRTRIHLFRKVELDGDKHAERFVALCRDFPHIPPLVVSLSASSCWSKSEDQLTPFPILPSLRNITVQEFWEDGIKAPLTLSHNQSYISATFLWVEGFPKILEMIGGSPELQHLALLSVTTNPENLPAQYADFQKYILFEGHSLRPESFAIEFPFEELYDILLSPQSVISFERLRDFAISIMNEDDLDFAVTVVKATVNTLQNLRIQINWNRKVPIWPYGFMLSHIHTIDIIAFCPGLAHKGSQDDLDCWMMDCLTTKTNLLEKATIRFSTPNLGMEPPSLSDWDNVLTGELMPSFRLLNVQVIHGHDVLDPSVEGIFRTKVEAQFPVLQSHGRLNIEFKVDCGLSLLDMLAVNPY